MATKLGRTINWDESYGKRKSGEELIVRPMVTPLTGEDGESKARLNSGPEKKSIGAKNLNAKAQSREGAK